MDTLFSIILWIHIPCGVTAAAIFWIPLILKKGSRLHRRIGWVFVYLMAIASITAAMLAALRWVMRTDMDFSAAKIAGPLFLLNVSLLTFTSVHHGISILRQKGRAAPHRGVVDIALPAALVLLGVISIIIGILCGQVLLFTLPIVGLYSGGQYLFALLRTPRDSKFWWYQHMAGMFGGCIASITASLVINARHITPHMPLPEWVFWISPAAIGMPLLYIWQGIYRRKFRASKS
jgi:uncharacterized membrane protein